MWKYAEVIVFVQNNVSSLKTVYWSISELWSYLYVDTYEFSLIATQITFEGISGSSYTGDIAIDDVSLMEGICAGKI